MYFSDRGVRPMGRAGAWVAGADDLGAIWYNPAGLADAKTSLLVDFGWLDLSAQYTRQLYLRDADNIARIVPSPKVSGGSSFLPIPTIAYAHTYGAHDEWTFAGAAYGPYVALTNYPATVDGQPSPARYAAGSYDGSLLGYLGAWAAYKPIEELRLGLGIQALVGTFQTTSTFTMSLQDRLFGAPEQPEWDATSQIRVGPIFAPTGNAGVTFVPNKVFRVGTSLQLPTVVSTGATIKIQLPSASVFDGGSIQGQDAHVRFVLPAIYRAGVEVRPIEKLRVELAWVHEFWSAHQSIDSYPQGMYLTNVAGLPPKVVVPPIIIPRNFQDADSFRLGGEYDYELGGYHVATRAGVSYETSAVPTNDTSLLSLDSNKVLASIGGSIWVGGHYRFDALYAHMFVADVFVPPQNAAIPRINPFRANAVFEGINGGNYSASADLFGVGLVYFFEDQTGAKPATSAPAPVEHPNHAVPPPAEKD
jgi:long-chain fatty acid transport protein